MNLVYCELGIRRRALSSKKHAPLVHFLLPSPIHPTHLYWYVFKTPLGCAQVSVRRS